MKKNLKLFPLLMFTLILLAFATLIVSVQALDNPYVWVEDEQGIMRDMFVQGEKLRVKAYDGSGSSINPYRVRLYYSPDDGTTWIMEKEWLSHTPNFDSGLLDDATNKLGRWKAEVKNYECKYAIGMYNVIPEVAFGALGAVATCFAAFGLKSLRTKGKI